MESLSMIPWQKALESILVESRPLSTEEKPVLEALGRTLAKPIIAKQDLPSADNSAMDGFAVRCSDMIQGKKYQIRGEISAGPSKNIEFQIGEVVRIMTGGEIPKGADAVLKVEDAIIEGDTVHFRNTPTQGENIRYQGEDVRAGKTLFEPGQRINPYGVGMISALGFNRVEVYQRPTVAILPTGDEILEPGTPPVKGMTYNSNGPMLSGLVEQLGAISNLHKIAKDDRAILRKALESGMESDVLLTCGGVSKGLYDFIPEELKALGVNVRFHKVAIKPGKPLFFGIRESPKRTLVFGIPGNPVATAVVFELFVRPALLRLMGEPFESHQEFFARAEEDIVKKPGMAHFVRGVLREEDSILSISTTGAQGSHLLTSLIHANALIHLDEENSGVRRGDRVRVIPLRGDFYGI